MKLSLTIMILSSILAVSCSGNHSSHKGQTSSSSPATPASPATSSTTTSSENTATDSQNQKSENVKDEEKKQNKSTIKDKTYTYTCKGHLIGMDGLNGDKDNDVVKKITVSDSPESKTATIYTNEKHSITLQKAHGKIAIEVRNQHQVIGSIKSNLGTKTLEIVVLDEGDAAQINCSLSGKIDKKSKKLKSLSSTNYSCSATISADQSLKASGFERNEFPLVVDLMNSLNTQKELEGKEEVVRVSSFKGMSHISTGDLNNPGVISAYAGVSMDAQTVEYLMGPTLSSLSHVYCEKK